MNTKVKTKIAAIAVTLLLSTAMSWIAFGDNNPNKPVTGTQPLSILTIAAIFPSEYEVVEATATVIWYSTCNEISSFTETQTGTQVPGSDIFGFGFDTGYTECVKYGVTGYDQNGKGYGATGICYFNGGGEQVVIITEFPLRLNKTKPDSTD